MTPLLFGALAVAALELDATQFGQLGLSRPLVVGPLLGLALGQAQLGAFLGAACELFGLKDLPVGGHLPLNATVAAGGAVLLACADAGALPPELAFPAGLGLGWAHRAGEGRLRELRGRLTDGVEARVQAGGAPALGRTAMRAMAGQALWTFGLLAAALAARGALGWAWGVLPGALRDGAAFAWGLSPWLALAALAHALGVQRRAA